MSTILGTARVTDEQTQASLAGLHGDLTPRARIWSKGAHSGKPSATGMSLLLSCPVTALMEGRDILAKTGQAEQG